MGEEVAGVAGSVSTSPNSLLMVKKKDKIPFSHLVPRKINCGHFCNECFQYCTISQILK